MIDSTASKVESLVLLPGLHGTKELFAPLLKALPETLRPVNIEYPQEPQDYQALKDYVLARLPTDRPFVLLGESFSGPVAVLAASEAPAGLRGVILCSSFVASPDPRRGGRLAGLLRLLPVGMLGRRIGPRLLLGRFATPETRRLLMHVLDHLPANLVRARLRQVLTCDVTSQLSRIDLPMLYLQASEDGMIPAKAAEPFTRHARHGRVVSVAGPHGLLQCAPTETVRVIEEFIDGL